MIEIERGVHHNVGKIVSMSFLGFGVEVEVEDLKRDVSFNAHYLPIEWVNNFTRHFSLRDIINVNSHVANEKSTLFECASKLEITISAVDSNKQSARSENLPSSQTKVVV